VIAAYPQQDLGSKPQWADAHYRQPRAIRSRCGIAECRRSGAGWVCENHPDVLGTIS